MLNLVLVSISGFYKQTTRNQIKIITGMLFTSFHKQFFVLFCFLIHIPKQMYLAAFSSPVNYRAIL